jgi:restriction system protein
MGLWLVRAGKHGEQEDKVIEKNIAAIGWLKLPDLSSIKSREELKTLYERTYPDTKKMVVINNVAQVWAFINRIKEGDLVVLPLKRRAAIAIGKVTGPYEYRTDITDDIRHTRPIKWIKTDLPRTAFSQDLLYSFGAYMTVCQISRNDAEERVRKILEGKKEQLHEVEEPEKIDDIEQAARDQILEHINREFKGHGLARLVEAVLKAQGYVTKLSEPGPDGGVDLLAASGPMGFDKPYLCVQVKSSDSPADVTVLRNLQGVIKSFGADQGLFVSWGGFNMKVHEEAKRSFFTVRLWDSGDLIEAIFKYYEKFDDELKAALPLKRIWCLVREGD